MACVDRARRVNLDADVTQKPREAVVRHGSLHPDDGRAGRFRRRVERPHDRRDLFEGTPHGFDPGVEKSEPLTRANT